MGLPYSGVYRQDLACDSEQRSSTSNCSLSGDHFFIRSGYKQRGYVLLRDRQKLKWVLAIPVIFVSFQSYFARELLAALFFFTILYVILTALAVLYLLIDHALYYGILWPAWVGRSFYSLLHHHPMCPARVPSLPKGRALDSGQELGHA
jgi:hypothetical protein